jgi:hypothetical protein
MPRILANEVNDAGLAVFLVKKKGSAVKAVVQNGQKT